jgi:hypothetical protein
MKKAVDLFESILDIEEFVMVRYQDGTWGLQDRQGANLGDIESERFENMAQVLDRMEIYHIDYFEESVMEYFDIHTHNGYVDLVRQCRKQILEDDGYDDYSQEDLDILEFIGLAPELEICKKPFDELENLYYEDRSEL